MQSAPDGSSKTVVDPKSSGQQAGPDQTAKDPVPPATDKSEPSRAGTQEPGGKVEGTAQKGAFEKGTLTAPGALTDVDTAPAKFSARTAADDALPIAAYTLKHLSDDQRRAIRESVRKGGSAGPTPNADFARVGHQVPTAIALSGLKALPENTTTALPEISTVMFTKVAEKIVLINPRPRRHWSRRTIDMCARPFAAGLSHAAVRYVGSGFDPGATSGLQFLDAAG